MAARHFTIPFLLRSVKDVPYFVADLALDIRNADGQFCRIDYVRFDTGTGFTTLPTAIADENRIPYSKNEEIKVTGATGTGMAYLDKLTFAIPDVSGIEFSVDCLFSPSAPRPLLSLGDVVRNFDLSTRRPTDNQVYGGLLLTLRTDHKGQRC